QCAAPAAADSGGESPDFDRVADRCGCSPNSAYFRSQRALVRAEAQSRRDCGQFDHAKNAGALGARAWNRSGNDRTRTARFLESNFTTLVRPATCRENKKLFHS